MTQRSSPRRTQSRTVKSSVALKAVATGATHFISPKLAMRVREEKGGYGVFAMEPIARGELLVMWGGSIVSGDQLKNLTSTARRHSIQVEEDLFLAPHELPEPADFINHSCNPNAGLSGQTGLVALTMINAGEEICYDYAMSDGSPYDEFQCACGSWNCRQRVTGNDWLILELQQRYAGYFSPYLARRIEAAKMNPALRLTDIAHFRVKQPDFKS